MKLVTPRKRLAAIFVIGYLIVLPFMLLVDAEEQALIKSGDFPAFYSAAVMLKDGLGHQLYDWEIQKKIQVDLKQKDKENYSPFAYPPYFAAVLAPFAYLPFWAGKWILVLLMVLCLAVSAWAARDYSLLFRSSRIEQTAFFIAFAPLSMSVLGAQNTALSLMLFSLAIKYLKQNKPKGDFFCGIFLGLWLFKPHYPILLIFLFFLAGCRRVAGGFILSAFIWYLIGAWVSGFQWPLVWLQAIKEYSALEFPVNQSFMISISGFISSLSALSGTDGVSQQWTSVCISVLSAGIFFFLASLFLKAGKISDLNAKREKILYLTDLAVVGIVLISPHSLLYDFGIIVVAMSRYLDLSEDNRYVGFVGWIFLINFFALARTVLPFQPIFFILAGCFIYLVKKQKLAHESI